MTSETPEVEETVKKRRTGEPSHSTDNNDQSAEDLPISGPATKKRKDEANQVQKNISEQQGEESQEETSDQLHQIKTKNLTYRETELVIKKEIKTREDKNN